MTESEKRQVLYNICAFGKDVKNFSIKRDRARTEKSRLQWQRKIVFAEKCLNDNKNILEGKAAAK